VGGASIGTSHTTLSDVELFEKDQGPGEQPWLRIKRIEADVPLTDLLGGGLPSGIRMGGVVVTLRFDDEGRLLTVLPPRPADTGASLDALPEIAVTDGQVLLAGTQGRQVVFDPVEATLEPKDGRHELRGKGATAALGNWTAGGWASATWTWGHCPPPGRCRRSCGAVCTPRRYCRSTWPGTIAAFKEPGTAK